MKKFVIHFYPIKGDEFQVNIQVEDTFKASKMALDISKELYKDAYLPWLIKEAT